jgi:copper(I)-binding protein
MRLLVLAGIVAAYSVTGVAWAIEYKVGSITIKDPWSRATPKGASTAVGYMTIKNTGTTTDRLVGGSVDTASGFQLHSMVIENGVAKMRELSAIEIKPGQSIEFKPDSSHVMFVGLNKALSKGEHITGSLIFEHAGKVQVEYEIQAIGARQATDHAH